MNEDWTHDRDLDAWIAKHVMGLKSVGYYRRKSWNTSEWERCNKGDTSPADAGENDPKVCASLYYLNRSENPNSACAVPCYSADMNHAYSMVNKMRSKGYLYNMTSLFRGTYTWVVVIQGTSTPFNSFYSKCAHVTNKSLPYALCQATKIAREKSIHHSVALENGTNNE
ncbi:MAG: hypothetical protein GF334_02070 [Candidatus Altiarchaeales archaeon]|nr:hypothetical protein [Candidatus Altiarchaeales archaeon]